CFCFPLKPHSPFWGHSYNLSPKRDCGPKRANDWFISSFMGGCIIFVC
ncbi:unnamed protein product, partial [Laminaria digitata]